ncbi:arylsulfatase [Halalkalibaculum sp. DA384]|uniref:arylsulfatase n=1 Tax=Halalkalibaculum sp. DA384 TaxID=3373606 RepID=UPI003753FC65
MVQLRPVTRQALTGILVLMLAFCLGCSGEDSREKNNANPNIVLVLADDLGYSDIGAYGSEISTPNLDRLAENGIRFTRMHNTSKCFPSRAVLLTGLYAQQSGMHEQPEDFHHSVMFGEVLKRAGYRTLFVGKHHGTDNPHEWGFDHYWGLRDGAANYFNPGEQRPSDPGPPAQKEWAYPRTFAFDDSLVAPFTPSEDYYGTDSWTDWSIELLGQYEEEEKPFLLYLSYQAPHDPLQAPEESVRKYEGVYENGYEAIAQARYERQIEMGLLDDRYPRSEPEYPQWEELSDSARADQVRRMQVYAGMIDRMDQNIGRLIETIKAMGEWENTLFMFASDNGASAEVVQIGEGPIGSLTRWASLKEDWANVANTPFRKYKNYSHEGGTATPFIVHWPEVIADGGAVNHTLTHFIDLMPTLIDITGAEYPERYKGEEVYPLAGVSMRPLFEGGNIERESPLYYDWGEGSAIQTEEWKLVRWGSEWELYDMQNDRTETTNLAGEHPEITRELKQKWREWSQTWK